MRKTISMLLAAILATSLLAGCSQSAKATVGEVSSEPAATVTTAAEQTFEIAHVATEANQIALYEKIFTGYIDEYNSANATNYKLKFTPSQNKDVTNTRMASSDKPDILLLDSPADVAQYVKDDLLLDLTKYADEGNWQATMFPWAYNLSKTNEKVYSLPYGYEGIVIWYNKDLMNQLGVNPADLKDLVSFEATLQKAKDAGITPIMLGSQDWPWAQEWYLSIMFSYTGRDLLKKTLAGEGDAKWTNPKFAKTVDLYKSWHDKGFLADGKSYVLTSDDAINAFTNDKTLFKLEGTWAPYWMTNLEQTQKDKIGVMLHPAINSDESPHIPIAVGGMWVVSKDTEAPDLAGFLMTKLLSPDIQSEFLAAGQDVAPIAIPENEFANLDANVKAMWMLLNGALAKGDYGYTTYAFYPPETRVYSYEGIVNVMEGNITTADYLTKMQELTDKERASGFMPILP